MSEIAIDRERCIASEICVASFPEALAIDDAEQVAVLLPGAEGLSEDDREELVTMCPMGAIRLVGGD